MSEPQVTGGAAPSLAAHSKDASTPGPTPASATAPQQPQNSAPADNQQEGHGSEAGLNIDSSVSDAVAAVRELAPTADEARAFMRDHTMTALVVTGVACFLLGLLVGRR